MPEQPTKGTAPLYLEIPSDLRQRLDAFVKRTRRTLKGEVTNAIEQYLDREETNEPGSISRNIEEAAPSTKRKRKKGERSPRSPG